MKQKITLLLAVLLIGISAQAQSPEGFNYQAVIRDAANEIIASQNVGIQFRLLEGSPAGSAVYTETHSPTTDDYGLVALTIGTGTTGDVFANINWGNGPYFLEIAADISGGTSYSILGTQQLMSVPYALYAKSSGNMAPSDEIVDADGDTKIQVEETADEDIIRFDLGGSEALTISKNAHEEARIEFPGNNNNNILGNNAGEQTLLGVDNIAIGNNAGRENIFGEQNLMIGSGAGANSKGNQNIFMGIHAGSNNTNGNRNVYLGSNAGNSNQTGSQNIFIGNSAGYNELTSNKLYIENSGSATPLIYGEFDNDFVTVNGDFSATGVISGDGSGLTNLPVGSSIFEKSGNLILPDANTVDIGNDDFVFGSTQLDNDANPDHYQRMFFDKSKAAFRVGEVTGDFWDEANRGVNSFASGFNTKANGTAATAMGYQTTASGFASTAIGISATASGRGSVVIGESVNATSDNAIALGSNANANGYASIAIGASVRSESAYETAIGHYDTSYTPNSTTAWNTDDRLFTIGNGINNNNRSDAMVVLKNGNTSINGDFNATGVISGDGSGLTNLPISSSIFEKSGNLILPDENTVDIGNDDFVFGSPQLDRDSDADHQNRMFFDKSKGAFRVGTTIGTSWDASNVGNNSFATGNSTTASGNSSFAAGNATTASGAYSTAFGFSSIASGDHSTALGLTTISQSFAEITIGMYNTGYTPNSATGWDSEDRLFTIGNGQSFGNYSDALIVYKSGNTSINGDFNATGVISGDGSGLTNLPGGTADHIADADGDTKIQVEETANEDIIRFDAGGTQVGSVNSDGVWNMVASNHNLLIGNGNTGTGGSENTAIGSLALRSNIAGVHNTAIGYRAGHNSTGSGNLFIGANAGLNETGNNTLHIKNSSDFISGPLIYGEFDNDLVRVNGDFETTGDIDVTGVISGDGSGLTNLPISSGSYMQDTDGDTKIQVEETADEDIIRFDVAGLEVGNVNSDGVWDMIPDTSTGNLLIGGGNSGTGGRLNVFIGGNAGRIYNETLQDTYNTALGTNAMFSLETGVSNTAIGYGSLFNNTASSQNTTLGFETGYNNISGSGNVFIGYRAAKNETGSNKLYIENSSSTSPLIYGEFDTDLVRINGDIEVTGVSDVNTVLASNIGIGLPSAPSQKLSVAGNFKLGTNGSTLTNIIKVDVAKNIGNISSDDHLDVTFSVPGSLVGSSVMVSPSADLPNQVILGQARVSANGTVRVRFHNESNSGKDPANMTFYITVIK